MISELTRGLKRRRHVYGKGAPREEPSPKPHPPARFSSRRAQPRPLDNQPHSSYKNRNRRRWRPYLSHRDNRTKPEWRNGIRSGLKIRRPQGLTSSSLVSGTGWKLRGGMNG